MSRRRRRLFSSGTLAAVWARGVIGMLFCLTGGVFFGQGIDVIHGSGMSGHSLWAVIGGVLVVIGLALLVSLWRIRNGRIA